MPVFRIQWLGEKAMILDTTYIERDDMIAAGTMASNRWTHSYHLIPDGCRGFYLTELFASETQTLEIKEIPLSQRPSKHDALIEKLMAESDEI